MSDKKKINKKVLEKGQETPGTSGVSGSGVPSTGIAPPASVSDPIRPNPFFERLGQLQAENATNFTGHHQDDTDRKSVV